MVALKRCWCCRWSRRRPPKQERRGGIETQDRKRFRAIVRMKQERRGGIETFALYASLTETVGEAGTPWWH